MARKSWQSLSANYRNRLQRAGITQADYESGSSLSKARGHAHTPEHPSDAEKDKNRYKKYRDNRNRLVQMVIERKQRLFGSQTRYNHIHSVSYVKDGVPNLPGFEQTPPSVAELKAAVKKSDDQILNEARNQRPEKSYWWYH